MKITITLIMLVRYQRLFVFFAVVVVSITVHLSDTREKLSLSFHSFRLVIHWIQFNPFQSAKKTENAIQIRFLHIN